MLKEKTKLSLDGDVKSGLAEKAGDLSRVSRAAWSLSRLVNDYMRRMLEREGYLKPLFSEEEIERRARTKKEPPVKAARKAGRKA